MSAAASDKPLTKAERLRVAGAIAPAVRRGSTRRVVVTDATGKPLREATLGEIQAAIARRHDIEFGTNDETRPKERLCTRCKALIKIRKQGAIPKFCYGGCRCRCGERVGKTYAYKKTKHSGAPVCHRCMQKASVWAAWKSVAEQSGVKRATFYHRVKSGMSPEKAATTPFISMAERRKPSGLWTVWRPIAESNGIGVGTWQSRMSRDGMSPEEAATRPLVVNGWTAWKRIAMANGVSATTWGWRVRKGWSEDVAATQPVMTPAQSSAMAKRRPKVQNRDIKPDNASHAGCSTSSPKSTR